MYDIPQPIHISVEEWPLEESSLFKDRSMSLERAPITMTIMIEESWPLHFLINPSMPKEKSSTCKPVSSRSEAKAGRKRPEVAREVDQNLYIEIYKSLKIVCIESSSCRHVTPMQRHLSPSPRDSAKANIDADAVC